MAIGREGNVKWIDGLRGLASLLTVFTHISRAYAPELFLATTAEGQAPTLLQLPIIRVLFQGRFGVSIFAFATGYVCALKPTKLYRQGQQEAGFISISKSSLRRFPRLFLPAAVATFVAWILAETGMYSVVKHADPNWLDGQAHARMGALGPALYELFANIFGTWVKRANHYGSEQWTMLPLLQESIIVYAFVVATAYLKSRFRMLACVGLWLYFWFANEAVFKMEAWFGVLIAELQYDDAFTSLRSLYPLATEILSASFCLVGLSIASLPEANWEYVTWSHKLHDFMAAIAPERADYTRFSCDLGLDMMILGVVLSPWLQKILSHKWFLFLGRMSFAVYLLHMQMLKTTMTWMMYGISAPADHVNDKSETVATRLAYPGHQKLLFCLVFWLPLLYWVAYLWTTYVDPWCEKVTNKLVEFIKLDSGEKPAVYLPMANGHGA